MRPAATSSFSAVTSWSPSETVNRPSSYETRRDGDARQHLDALAAEHVRHDGRGLRLDRPEDVRSELEHGDLHAEAGHCLRQLGPDRATADDRQRRGQGVGAQDVAVGPERRVRQSVDRWRCRTGAGVEQHTLRRLVGLAVHLDGAGTREPGVATDEPGSGVLEPLHRDGVVPVVGGLVADARVHRRPVGADLGAARQVVDASALGEGVGCADDHLAGDAPVVGTLATDQPLVDRDDVEPRSAPGRPPPPHLQDRARSPPRRTGSSPWQQSSTRCFDRRHDRGDRRGLRGGPEAEARLG